MNTLRRLAFTALVTVGLVPAIQAQTDGQVAFTVTTVSDGGQYSPRNVFAIWVTDAQTNFVKTLLCRANTQKRWLIKWNQQSGGNVVDGITGATRSSHGATNVTWNCRNASGALVPDGTYRILVEFTEWNGQGPYTTAVSFLKGPSPVSLTPANLPRFTGINLSYTPLNAPPELAPIPFQSVLEGETLTFAVTASPTGGDPVTLTASNLPAGATFAATNGAGTFLWPAASPTGIYTSRFYAADKDGVTVREATIMVRVPGAAALGVALGSPIILTDPPSTENNPGEAFDLDPSGGAATTTDLGGFGSFGRVYLNEDDTHLYLGAEGCDLAGDNNAMILFLGIDTLADNRLDLGAQSGLPNALDTLANLRFASPVDLAIVLGDEYGDATFPNFNLGNGDNMGQGVYRLGDTSFVEVPGARLAQFDGAGTDACLTGDDDGNRLTDRWECAIPWSSLNAALGIGSVSELTLAGVFVNSSVSGSNRYVSANHLGADVIFHGASDIYNNPGYGNLTLTPLAIDPQGGIDLAVGSVSPETGGAGTIIPLSVTVSNRQNRTATFVVTATNLTAAGPGVSMVVSNLGRASARTVTLPWDTTGLAVGSHLLRIAAGPLPGELSIADNQVEHGIYLRTPVHNLALRALRAPLTAAPGNTVMIEVDIDNTGDFPETVVVSLTDETAGAPAGSPVSMPLPAMSSVTLTTAWPTAGAALGWHTLRASVEPAAGETDLADNEDTAAIALATAFVTNRVLVSGDTWRFNGEGLNLFPTPWGATRYFDGHWNEGPSPFGIGLPAATDPGGGAETVHFFRAGVHVDIEPVAVRIRLARDDGAAVFLDGRPLFRDNLPTGTLDAATLALTPVTGAAQTSFAPHETDPAPWTRGAHVLGVSLHPAATSVGSAHPWINEFHYDNDDGDVNEGVEVAGAAGHDLGRYSLAFYNGYNGTVYSNVNLTGTLPDQGGGAGAAWFAIRRIQNGAPDGLALVVDGTGVVEFLSYEGTFTAQNGPAAGMTSVNLPVYEDDLEWDATLQRTGSGSAPGDFTWIGPAGQSRGAINAGQTITHDLADLYLDVEVDLVVPDIPAARNLAVTAVTPARDALAGDIIPVAIDIANQGNRTETFTLVLIDGETGQVLATSPVTVLGSGASTRLILDWNTAGLQPGQHDLSALLVQDGVTNVLGAVTAPGIVSGSGLGLRAVGGDAALGGFAGRVLLTGSLAVAAEGATLSVHDLGNPDQPQRLAALALPGRIEAMVLDGNWLFTANGAFGVQVVDLSDPARPVHRQTLDTPGHATDLAVDGDRLWIADGVAGLRCADITDPLAPAVISHLATGGSAGALAVAGTRLYLADAFEGLMVVDIADPAHPVRRGTSPEAGFGADVLLHDAGSVWIPTREGRCLLVDVSDPDSPAILGGMVTGTAAEEARLDQARLYVAGGAAGLLVYDVTDPLQPIQVATEPSDGRALGLDILNSRIALADGGAGIRLFDLPALTERGTTETAGRAVRADLEGDLLLLAAGEQGLRIYSLANPSLPALAGSVSAIGNVRDVAVEGTLAAAVGLDGILHLVDLATPSAPVPVAAWPVPGADALYRVAMTSNRVLAVGFDTAWQIDISIPSAPVPVGSATFPARIHDADFNGALAAVALGADGVAFLNGAGSLAVVGTYLTATPATAVLLEGALAWVAGVDGWIALDLQDPANPVLQTAHGGHGPSARLAAAGRYLAEGAQGGQVVMHDRSDLVVPLDLSTVSNLTALFRLDAGEETLAVLQEDAGAVLVALAGPDTDGDGLDDRWEQALVDADPNDAYATIADILPGDDFDGDGLSNRQEFVAGTSALDAGSMFMVQGRGESSSGRSIRWPSSPGRTYAVWMTGVLGEPFSPVATGIAATPPLNEQVLPGSDQPTSFYIVVVEP